MEADLDWSFINVSKINDTKMIVKNNVDNEF